MWYVGNDPWLVLRNEGSHEPFFGMVPSQEEAEGERGINQGKYKPVCIMLVVL